MDSVNVFLNAKWDKNGKGGSWMGIRRESPQYYFVGLGFNRMGLFDVVISKKDVCFVRYIIFGRTTSLFRRGYQSKNPPPPPSLPLPSHITQHNTIFRLSASPFFSPHQFKISPPFPLSQHRYENLDHDSTPPPTHLSSCSLIIRLSRPSLFRVSYHPEPKTYKVQKKGKRKE